MTDREFFVKTIEDEMPRFERAFKALPEDKLDYHPHERSRNAIELVGYTAIESSTFPVFLKTGEIDFAVVAPTDMKSPTLEAAIKMFIDGIAEGKEIAAKMTEDDWASKAVMKTGEKIDWETTKGGMAWGLLLDLIHHRGQLSSYIRPMGGKVPSIYGPSGDTGG